MASVNHFLLIDQTENSAVEAIGPGIQTYTGVVRASNASDYSLTRTFFWQPDQRTVLNIGHEQRQNTFKNSFPQKFKFV